MAGGLIRPGGYGLWRKAARGVPATLLAMAFSHGRVEASVAGRAYKGAGTHASRLIGGFQIQSNHGAAGTGVYTAQAVGSSTAGHAAIARELYEHGGRLWWAVASG